MISYASQLRQVRDSLTPENWHKGGYFRNKNNILCMCVHGAAQALVNPEVKKALRNKDINDAEVFVRRRGLGRAHSAAAPYAAAASSTAATKAAKNNPNLLEVWKARPDYVKQDYISPFNNLNYGNTNLHYLMGIFGITTTFNDNSNITLEDLKDKLSEAAKWAEENEEFLSNN